MAASRRISGIRGVIFITSVLMAGALNAQPTGTLEQASAGGAKYKYVRIFTARVDRGTGLSLAELEEIARDVGTKEIALFLEDNGPENKEYRWTLREGSNGYHYPGYTLKVRSHLAEKRKNGALTLSADGKTASETLPCFSSPVGWIFPQDDISPLMCHIFEDGTLTGTITVYEKQQPSGGQPWPEVIRMDDLEENESLIQVFEYLEDKPAELPPIQTQPVLGACDLEELARLDDIGHTGIPDPAGTSTQSIDLVKFFGKWGCDGFNVNWEWSHGSVPWLEFKFHFGAKAVINSEVSGNFILEIDADPTLTAGSGHGRLGYGFELGLWALLIFDSGCPGFGSFEFPLPYIPNFDFGLVESKDFSSFFASPKVELDGLITEQTVFSHGFDISDDISGTLEVNATLSLAVDMGPNTMWIYDEGTGTYLTFSETHLENPVTLTNGGYRDTVNYADDNTDLSLEMEFTPDVCVSIDPLFCSTITRCISNYITLPSFTIPFPLPPLPSADISLDFSKSILEFDSTSIIPDVVPRVDSGDYLSKDRSVLVRTAVEDTSYATVAYTFDTYTFDPTEGGWNSVALSARGDFAGLLLGYDPVQEDPYNLNLTWLWAFIENSTYNYACGGLGGQTAVPDSAEGEFLKNEVWSPLICWTGTTFSWPDTTYPLASTRAELRFDVYRDLPFDYGIFYVWHVRSWMDGHPGPWRDRGYVYYGEGKDWFTAVQPIGDLIETGAEYIQVALGAWDMARYWNPPYYSFGDCQSHAPLFDNVRIYRYINEGPAWGVRDIDLFQDTFSEDGTATGTARADMAADINPINDPTIRPGDSVCVWVNDPIDGLSVDAFTMYGPAAYCFISVDPSQYTGLEKEAPEMRGGMTRFPCVDTTSAAGRTWHVYRMDSCVTSSGVPVADRYCVDFNDALFVPGDTCWFFFGAADMLGEWSYWTEFIGETAALEKAAEDPMEFQVLPTGDGSILYVDKYDGMGAQSWFDLAFAPDKLNASPDRYDVRGPSSCVGNGLGSRVVSWTDQLIPFYRSIIWNTGDLSRGTIGDGSSNPCKENDAGILYLFLAQHTSVDGCGIYFSGDDIAEEWSTLTGSGAHSLRSHYIDFTVLGGDQASGIKSLVSPLVVAQSSSIVGFYDQGLMIPDTLVAYGGHPIRNDFDVIQPLSSSLLEMAYDNNASKGAVISSEGLTLSGWPARVVLSGFSYHEIRDDHPAVVLDRLDHLYDILAFFGDTLSVPTGTGIPPRYKNNLAQNYPNPFNPVTTIEYSIKERAPVTLRIYNVAGQLVKTLINSENMDPARVRPVVWNGRNNSGHPVASGVYFYKLVTKDFTKTKKMVLLK